MTSMNAFKDENNQACEWRYSLEGCDATAIPPNEDQVRIGRARARWISSPVILFIVVISWTFFVAGEIPGMQWPDDWFVMAITSALMLGMLFCSDWFLAWQWSKAGLFISEAGFILSSPTDIKVILADGADVFCLKRPSHRYWTISFEEHSKRLCIPASYYPSLKDDLDRLLEGC